MYMEESNAVAFTGHIIVHAQEQYCIVQVLVRTLGRRRSKATQHPQAINQLTLINQSS
jgi:hypothetical protein